MSRIELDDLEQIGVGLREIFPQIGKITPTRILGSGFNSVALETAEGVVFRIARNQFAVSGYRKEARYLPIIGAYASAPIPNPQWYIAESAAFPFGVIGYRKLDGTPMQPETLNAENQALLIRSLARFVVSLHSVPREMITEMPQTEIDAFTGLRDDVMPSLKEFLNVEEHAAIANWWDRFLSDPALRNYQPVLCHGDLWYENILVDTASQRVAGILDFENMQMGDPALDFVALLYLGDAFVVQMIREYQAMGGELGVDFLRRLNLWWGLREFSGVQHSVQLNDEEELRDSIDKIRRGPILTPREFRL